MTLSKNRAQLFLSSIVLFSVLAQSARAEQEVESLKTTPDQDSSGISQFFKNKVEASFWGNLSGAGFDNMMAGDTPATDGSSASAQGLNAANIAVRYRLGEGRSVGILQNLTSAPGKGDPLEMGDIAATYKIESWVDRGTFKLDGEFLAYAPTSVASRTATSIGALRAVITINRDFPGTLFSVGSYSFVNTSGYQDRIAAAANSSDDVSFYQAPYANYQLTTNTSAAIWIDLLMLHQRTGQQNWTYDQPDLKPGWSWDFAKNMNLNPYVNISTHDPRWENTYLGVFLSMKN